MHQWSVYVHDDGDRHHGSDLNVKATCEDKCRQQQMFHASICVCGEILLLSGSLLYLTLLGSSAHRS